jgi:hypothetical protein
MRSPHSALDNLCPFEMLYAYLPKIPLAVRDAVAVDAVNCISPLQHYHDLLKRKKNQFHSIALTLEKRMHAHVMNRIENQKRKWKQPDIKEGDLVMEIPPTSGPLQTNIKGPFLVVAVNLPKNIVVLQTGGTATNLINFSNDTPRI